MKTKSNMTVKKKIKYCDNCEPRIGGVIYVDDVKKPICCKCGRKVLGFNSKIRVKQKPKELDYLKEYNEWVETTGLVAKGTSYYYEIESIIENALTQQRTELLNNILEENHCDLDGTYDYDGIAESVIKLCKNK